MIVYTNQGPLDPSGLDLGNPATFPPPTTSALYQPGMYWTVDTAGSVAGVTVAPGDLVFVVGHGRTFGGFLFGDLVFGGPFDRDWVAQVVTFVPRITTQGPHLTDPFPYSGCPFGDTGWNIVVDVLYNSEIGSRTFGTDLFGDDVFGDVNGRGHLLWTDVTDFGFGATATHGAPEAGPIVEVDTLVVDVIDRDGDLFDVADLPYRPTVGSPVRVGLLDPAWNYYPVSVAEVERVNDVHETAPRLLTVEAFGFLMDMAVDLPFYGMHGGETAQLRVDRLVADAGGWRFGSVVFTEPDDPPMISVAPADVNARDVLDLTAVSAGWTMDTDRRGNLRFRDWPLEASARPAVAVVDCVDPPAPYGSLTASSIRLASDMDSLLTVATFENVADPPVQVTSRDIGGMGRFGPRTSTFDFPFTGLYFRDAPDAREITDRAIARYGTRVHRPISIEVDTLRDERWLQVLADLDTGQAFTVTRYGLPNVVSFDCVVVAWEHRITADPIHARIQSTIFLTVAGSALIPPPVITPTPTWYTILEDLFAATGWIQKTERGEGQASVVPNPSTVGPAVPGMVLEIREPAPGTTLRYIEYTNDPADLAEFDAAHLWPSWPNNYSRSGWKYVPAPPTP